MTELNPILTGASLTQVSLLGSTIRLVLDAHTLVCARARLVGGSPVFTELPVQLIGCRVLWWARSERELALDTTRGYLCLETSALSVEAQQERVSEPAPPLWGDVWMALHPLQRRTTTFSSS
jgi:hypothetical protein